MYCDEFTASTGNNTQGFLGSVKKLNNHSVSIKQSGMQKVIGPGRICGARKQSTPSAAKSLHYRVHGLILRPISTCF